jgi:hypothetical protein
MATSEDGVTALIDPGEVRSLPAGVAFVVSGGRAAKVAVTPGAQRVVVRSR